MKKKKKKKKKKKCPTSVPGRHKEEELFVIFTDVEWQHDKISSELKASLHYQNVRRCEV